MNLHNLFDITSHMLYAANYTAFKLRAEKSCDV